MAELMKVIKKNAGWHGLSLIVTGISAFLGVILTKQLLEPQAFIFFNVKLNALLMVNVFTTSWITTSMYRMIHVKSEFFRIDNLLFLALISALFVGLPSYLVWSFGWKPGGNFILPFILQLMVIIHAVLLVSQQATLNAKRFSAGESIRSITQVLGLLLPFFFNWSINETYCWLIWITSYLFGIVFFIALAPKEFYILKQHRTNYWKAKYWLQLKQIFKYGYPFCILILFSFLVLNADRWYLMSVSTNALMAADYIAIADIMMRGAGFLFMPMNTSSFPVISRLYDQKDYAGVRVIIKKVLLIQSILFTAAIAGMFVFQKLLFTLLNLSDSSKPMRLCILLFSMHCLWQAGFTLQKPAEMKAKIFQLSLFIAIGGFLVYGCLWFFVEPQTLERVALCLAAGIGTYIVLLLLYVRFYLFKKA